MRNSPESEAAPLRRGLAFWAPGLEGDQLFDPDSPRNRDGWLDGFHETYSRASAAGWDVHTHDWFIAREYEPEIVIYLDVPRAAPRRLQRNWAAGAESWVLLQESELIIPRNWRIARHRDFQRVFTWHPEFFGRDPYRELRFSAPLNPPSAHQLPFNERKLVTMVAGNKRVAHKAELYSSRLAAIKWYEDHHPEAFDLYGMGWGVRTFSGRLLRVLNALPALRRAFAPARPSWRGPIDRKRDVLPRYRFAFCFENAADIPGYITEKLLECFTGGVVPIYRGPAEITDLVPAEAFVDWRNFSSFTKLHEHLANMTADEHRLHLDAAKAWLASDAARPYTPEAYGAAIVAELPD